MNPWTYTPSLHAAAMRRSVHGGTGESLGTIVTIDPALAHPVSLMKTGIVAGGVRRPIAALNAVYWATNRLANPPTGCFHSAYPRRISMGLSLIAKYGYTFRKMKFAFPASPR